MATGDIINVDINADGFSADITIEGFVDGGTYDYGLGANNDPTNAKVVFTATSLGYDADEVALDPDTDPSTVTRTIYGTETIRLPYPNNATLDETEDSGNLIIRVALSDYIYAKDTTGVGNSGTAVTVAIAAGWYTDDGTGGTTNPSVALSSTNVNNQNSTVAYPPVLGQWDIYAGAQNQDRVTDSTFTLAFNTRGHIATPTAKSGIACVIFDCDGQTSANNEQVVVTSETRTQRTATGNWASSFQATFNCGDFTDDEDVVCRARAYPAVGDTVMDTNDYTTAAHEIRGRNQHTIIVDPDNSLTVYGVVDTAGDDGTGVASATLGTAQASPFATWGGAVDGGANRIRLNAGTHLAVGSAPSSRVTSATSKGWIVAQPSSGASVTVQLDATAHQYKVERCAYHGVTIQRETTGGYLNGDDQNWLRFRDCTFDKNGLGSTTVPIVFGSLGAFFTNCGGDLDHSFWEFDAYGASLGMAQFDGCVFDETSTNTGALERVYRFVANLCNGQIRVIDHAVSGSNLKNDGMMIEFNKWVGYEEYNSAIELGIATDLGYSICGNVIENISGISIPMMKLAADGNTADVNHVLIAYNSVAGERVNIAYNDSGSSAYERIGWTQVGNLFEDWNTKHDTFATANAARIGGWAVLYGVNFKANMYNAPGYPASDDGGFDGLWTNIAATEGYIDDNSATGDSSGNGDYHLTEASDAYNACPAGVWKLPFDIEGNARPDDGTDHIGAYTYVAPDSNQDTLIQDQLVEDSLIEDLIVIA